MRFDVRVKYNKPGTSINGEKSYTIVASSAYDAKDQARNKCESEGYKFIGIVRCREMR